MEILKEKLEQELTSKNLYALGYPERDEKKTSNNDSSNAVQMIEIEIAFSKSPLVPIIMAFSFKSN